MLPNCFPSMATIVQECSDASKQKQLDFRLHLYRRRSLRGDAADTRVKAAPLMISPPRSLTASHAALRSTRAAPARACSNFYFLIFFALPAPRSSLRASQHPHRQRQPVILFAARCFGFVIAALESAFFRRAGLVADPRHRSAGIGL